MSENIKKLIKIIWKHLEPYDLWEEDLAFIKSLKDTPKTTEDNNKLVETGEEKDKLIVELRECIKLLEKDLFNRTEKINQLDGYLIGYKDLIKRLSVDVTESEKYKDKIKKSRVHMVNRGLVDMNQIWKLTDENEKLKKKIEEMNQNE